MDSIKLKEKITEIDKAPKIFHFQYCLLRLPFCPIAQLSVA